MSSAGIPGGVSSGAAVSQQYFCYQCNRTVSIAPSPSSDLVCPVCNGGFLEEYEAPSPNPNPTPNPRANPFFANFSDDPFTSGLAGIPLMFSSGSMDLQNPTDFPSIFTHRFPSSTTATTNTTTTNPHEPDVFNPFQFLQNYLQEITTRGGNVQFVVENTPIDLAGGGGGGPFRLPANLGDYFIGPGLEQLIQQLAENDPNRYGTPPAAKSAVQELPTIKIDDELLASDSSQCAVCKDEFELGMEAKQLPCRHIYHPDCIFPWLELHNSCPVCRYELPTDDPEYENRPQGEPGGSQSTGGSGTGAGDSGGSGAGSDHSPSPRQFRISFPWTWPFRGFGAPAEGSNSGFGNNDGNNDSGSNSGGRGNPNFGSETRQEDLD